MLKLRIKFVFFLITAIFPFHLYSSNLSHGVKSFDKLIYRAESHNWSVSTSANGMVYFANHKGLLEFDGTNWLLHNLPNQTILRAVKVQADSVIYASGYMELGYWKVNGYGTLEYFSLSDKAKQYFSKNIEFWNIAVNNETVYFQSFTRILSYKNDTILPVILPGFSSVMSKVGNDILVAVKDDAIYRIEGNIAKPYISGNFFIGKSIKFMLPYKNDQILIGTASHGIFIWDGKEFKQWNSAWTNYFISNELNRGYYSKSGQLILGTLIDGIVVFDNNENLSRKVNIKNGLPNNTVLGIDTDVWGNIWLALDDGIGFVSNQPNQSLTVEKIPGIGAIYSIEKINEDLYLGTNQGLYIKSIDDDNSPPFLVPGTQGQIWDCRIINNLLWVGHNQGTFLVRGKDAKKINNQSGGFVIKKDPKNDDLLIQSTYSDLVTYKLMPDNSIISKNIAGFYDLIRYIEMDHLGNIWASHMYQGIFKITTDDKRENVTGVKYYGENAFGKNHSIHVFKIENRIVFTTNNEIYTYDDLKDTIVPYRMLNTELGKFSTAHRIVEAPNHHYWFICDNSVALFEIESDKTRLIKEFPTSIFANTSLVDGFENLLPLTEKKALLSLQNGFATLDASVTDTFIINEFEPKIRKIQIYNGRGKSELFPLNTSKLKVKYNFHNLLFQFSFPFLSDFPVEYQYKLEGLNQVWSEKIKEPQFRFERLPKGKYTLLLKAVNLWGNESRISTFSFEILPPTYASPYALIAYFLILVAVLLGFRTWGIRQTRKKEQLQHEKRENELIQLRNEKLKNEIKHKSKELANSTMSLIKKNEFLLDLKSAINNQKAELGSRFPDKYSSYLNNKIDENISSQDDWQIFETNFERAHEQFFIKIKETYPDLTSSDLRLCAFLRMNLSSKEIAPLLGISVRGVENHRYKLRKKLNLEHDEILTDTILSI